MKITFLLPCAGGVKPVGGLKVVYEYANRLAKSHVVRVVHPALLLMDAPTSAYPKKLLRYMQRAIDKSFSPSKWFQLDPLVRLMWKFSLSEQHIPDSDVVIATAWQTAEWVRTYDARKGSKFYLIHDYEHYMVADQDTKKRMTATYTVGMHNIVTSPAGIEMLASCGASFDSYIPNGIDFNVFKMERDIDGDTRVSIGFPSRPESFKGTRDAVAALQMLHSRLGGKITVWSFGGRKPNYLPDWIDYYERPSDALLCDLYNRSKIFVVPSHFEGWGLPGAEAMACGAALASTDNGGVRAYAEHGQTALLSEPKDIDALAENINQLIQNEALRLRLAHAGHQHIQQFTWEKAVASFEAALLKTVNNEVR